MAVNPYSTPAQAQFINTYTPIPFQEMVQAGQARQQAYDVNRQAFEQQLAQARQLKAMPGADTQYIEGTVIPTFEELADKYATKDYGNQETIREINRAIGENIDRRLVGNIQSSYTGYQNYLKQKQQMEAKGTPILRSSLQDPSKHSTALTGVFSETPEAELDWRGATRDFFNDIEDSYLGTKGLPGGRLGLVHGVTAKQLMDYANENPNIWLQTPAGSQKVRDLRAQGMTGSDEDIAKAFLQTQAGEFVRSKVSNIYDPLNVAGRKEKKPELTSQAYVTDQGVPSIGTSTKRKVIKQATKNLRDYSNYGIAYTDKKGNQVSKLRVTANKLNSKVADLLNLDDEFIRTMFGNNAVDALHNEFKASPTFETKEGKNNLVALAARTAASQGITLDEFANQNAKDAEEQINTYLKDYQSRDKFADIQEIVDPEFSKYMNNQVLAKDKATGTFTAKGRKWYDPEQGAVPEYNMDDPNASTGFTKLENITKDYPTSEYQYYVSGEMSPYNNMMPSGYTVDILDKNGQAVKRVYMSGPDRNEGTGAIETSMQDNALRHTLYKEMFANPTGLVNVVDTYKGQPYRISGMALTDGVVDINVEDSNGNVVGTIKTRQEATPDVTMRIVEQELSNIFSNL